MRSVDPCLLVIDRCGEAPRADFPTLLDLIEARIDAEFGSAPLVLVGFSLGARPALEIAARLADRVVRIDLVSAAAPLACGVALRDIAGGAVFGLATNSPASFAVLARVQRVLARICPRLLVRLLFAGTRGADRDLARQAKFRARLADVLRQSFGHGSAGYRREIAAYVRPWEGLLPKVGAPVHLWHGSDDNWAPLAMAEWLARNLPNVVALKPLSGLSHYSALDAYLRQSQME
jgi:pimeloyl-ACP methyl ester carboxylesterase